LAQRDPGEIWDLGILGEQGALVGAQEPVAGLQVPLGDVRVPLVDVLAQVTGTGRVRQPVAPHELLPVPLVPLPVLDGLDGRPHRVEEEHAVLQLRPPLPVLGHLLLLPVLCLLHLQLLPLAGLLQLLESAGDGG